MSDWVDLLEDYALLIIKRGRVIYKSRQAGIIPLLKAIEECDINDLKNSEVLDRIVGRAAALLIAWFKATRVRAITMSKHAIQVLKNYGIQFEYIQLVEFIHDKTRTGMCPLEKAVMDIHDPEEALNILREKILK